MRAEHPAFFSGFPRNLALALFAGGDVRAGAEQIACFRRFAQAGDPLADALVAEMDALPRGEGRRLFEQAVEGGLAAVPHPPPALAAFIEHAEAVPPWLDRAQLDLAARALTRTGLVGLYGPLGDIALIGGYLASRPDKVLVRTGDLEHMAARRVVETMHWWVEVTSPGGLDRSAAGFKAILRVRVTHAHIRAAMHRRDDWRHDEWDHPVNQVQTAGTLLLFSLVDILGLRVLGFRFTRRERAAIFHLWRYVGRVMGVDPELLPAGEGDAWRLLWLEADTEFIPDDDSRRLAQALIAAIPNVHGLSRDGVANRLAAWLLTSLHGAYSHMTLGRRNGDLLGIPHRPPFQAAIVGFAAANFALETARRRIPGATRVSVVIGDRTRRAALRRLRASTGADLRYTRDGGSGPASHTALEPTG